MPHTTATGHAWAMQRGSFPSQIWTLRFRSCWQRIIVSWCCACWKLLRLLPCIMFGPWPHRMRTKWLWLDSNIFKQYITLISFSPFFCLISHYSPRVLFVSQLTCFCFLRDDLLRSSGMPQRDENCLVDFTSDLVLVHLVVMNSAFLGTKNDTSFCLLLEFWLVCVDLNSWNCEEEPRTKVGWNTWNSLDLGGHICSRVVVLVIMHV